MTIDANKWELERSVFEVRWVTENNHEPMLLMVDSNDIGEALLRAWLWALEQHKTPEKMEDMEVVNRLLLVC
jgi:hypothetical protein